MVARAAAQEMGLPPKVLPCAAARPVHDGIAGDAGAERHAGGDAFGGGDDIRFHIKVLDGPPFAGAAHARLDLVGDEQDIVFIAQFTQGGEEPGRRDDVTAFALDGFNQNAGHFVRRKDMAEDLFLDVADDRLAVILARLPVEDGAVGIREWSVDNAVHQRDKSRGDRWACWR